MPEIEATIQAPTSLGGSAVSAKSRCRDIESHWEENLFFRPSHTQEQRALLARPSAQIRIFFSSIHFFFATAKVDFFLPLFKGASTIQHNPQAVVLNPTA